MPSGRLRAVWELNVATARETVGRHEYDGRVQDLSPAGVRAALAALGGERVRDVHDEAHLAAAESGARAELGIAETHRWNPLVHIANLDVACYDRLYAPAEERSAARAAHLGTWSDAVDAAVASLDRVPAPLAASLLDAARGLADALGDPEGDDPPEATARAAHARFVEHLERAALNGPPEVACGRATLAHLLSDGEAMALDLGRMELAVERDTARVRGLLDAACARVSPDPPREVVARLLAPASGPDAADVFSRAAGLIEETGTFVRAADLLPELGGSCTVGPTPRSRRVAMAMLSWNAPFEAEAPAQFSITPPDANWSKEDKAGWQSVFGDTTLPAITVHEVTPGHFAHGRMLRSLAHNEIRAGLLSLAFVEGWAHYAEELMVEEGFRADDPRFAIGVCLEALVRTTRFAVALGIHGQTMTGEEAEHRFVEDAFLSASAARSEAARAGYDPTYGRYTWGKLEIMRLRDEAVARWGGRYHHRRFHEALLALGAPPLGTIGDALGND